MEGGGRFRLMSRAGMASASLNRGSISPAARPPPASKLIAYLHCSGDLSHCPLAGVLGYSELASFAFILHCYYLKKKNNIQNKLFKLNELPLMTLIDLRQRLDISILQLFAKLN